MLKHIVTAAALLSASQASADLFYCGAAPPVRLFQEAQASSEAYVVLLGALSWNVNLSYLDSDPHEPFAAGFDGHSLTAEGFTAPVAGPVTMTQVCGDRGGALPWSMCGDLGMPEHPVLLFARRGQDGSLSAEVGPCGYWAQSVPPWEVEEVAARLAACARGACPAP